MGDPRSTEELVQLLRESRGKEACRILYELARRPVVLDVADLLPHLEGCDEAFDCALRSRDLALVEPCAKLLATQWKAALVLATLGQRAYTAAIVEALGGSEGVEAEGYALALEVMGDPTCVPALLALAAVPTRTRAFALHHVLSALTGRRPRVAIPAEPTDWPAAFAAAWAAPAREGPVLVDVRVASTHEASFALDHGRARIRVDFSAFVAGSWPRWDRSLLVDGTPLYQVSSHCGTCRTLLHRTGALGSEAGSDALAPYRALVASLDHVDGAVLGELFPLVSELDTGHYLASLVDLPLERVERAERSWLARRGATDAELAAAGDDPADDWAGVVHHQAPPFGRTRERTWAVVVPTQDPHRLDEARVQALQAAIERGERPAVIALAWLEDRPLDRFDDEGFDRFLLAVVLDGHHKLEAYARASVPARVLFLAHLEQCSTDGPSPEALRAAYASLTRGDAGTG